MKNWLFFAKSINDESYKKFNIKITKSEYLQNKLTGQINHRKNEFRKFGLTDSFFLLFFTRFSNNL